MQTIILALVCGAAVGFCLGALGGGGGILVWPALVIGLGVSETEASLLAKIIVGSCALFAACMHWRKKTLDLRIGAMMGAVGMAGAWYGARFVDMSGMDAGTTRQLMLGLLALLMVAVAALMLRKGLQQRSAEKDTNPEPGQGSSIAPSPQRWVAFVIASAGIGFITGFLGVGGGFMIVPVLVMVFRMPMKLAAGTSLVVITLNCAAGIASSQSDNVRWDVAILFAISSISASAVAVRVSDRARQSTLQIAFSGLVVVLGALMVWKLTVV